MDGYSDAIRQCVRVKGNTMDLEGLTAAELAALIQEASTLMYQVQQTEATADAARRAQIGDAITALTNLLGPEGAIAGVDSIRAVRAYDAADIAAGSGRGRTMGENPGIALSLAFEGLEILTTLTSNLATVIAQDSA